MSLHEPKDGGRIADGAEVAGLGVGGNVVLHDNPWPPGRKGKNRLTKVFCNTEVNFFLFEGKE